MGTVPASIPKQTIVLLLVLFLCGYILAPFVTVYSFITASLTYWGHILFLVVLLLYYALGISKNNPLFFGVYIINWFILIFGLWGVLMYADHLKQQHNLSDGIIYLAHVLHLVYIVPLLYWIPYYKRHLSHETVLRTLLSVFVLSLIYTIFISIQNVNLSRLYAGFPLDLYVTLGFIFLICFYLNNI